MELSPRSDPKTTQGMSQAAVRTRFHSLAANYWRKRIFRVIFSVRFSISQRLTRILSQRSDPRTMLATSLAVVKIRFRLFCIKLTLPSILKIVAVNCTNNVLGFRSEAELQRSAVKDRIEG